MKLFHLWVITERQTLDIDYTTTAANASLERIIESLADEMKLELETVPIEEFIPLPDGAQTRHQFIGQFGNLAVYVFDPYSIALSKVARGFESDLEDVLFLIQNKLITLSELDQYVQAALPDAWTFDIDPDDLNQYLAEVYRMIET